MNVETICVGCMDNDTGDPVCPKCGSPFDLLPKNSLQMRPRTMLRDQYLVGRALGHGGFGITYLAWDTGLESRLAVKEYMPNGVAGRASGDTKVLAYSDQTKQEFEWGLDRFLDEARTLKKFSSHAGIVSVDTVFRENGTAYLVMEYLDGWTLEDFLRKRDGKVTFETALRLMMPVMDALSAVHAEGILHRDISPDNIYLTRAGKVKLIDFGAARNALSQKSRNLSIILKEGYAPEEQYRASGVQGPWTDVYATAATFYHCITGQIPQPAFGSPGRRPGAAAQCHGHRNRSERGSRAHDGAGSQGAGPFPVHGRSEGGADRPDKRSGQDALDRSKRFTHSTAASTASRAGHLCASAAGLPCHLYASSASGGNAAGCSAKLPKLEADRGNCRSRGGGNRPGGA